MPPARSENEVIAAKRLAVALRAEGKTHAEIAQRTGLSRPTVADALRRYAEGGDAALASRKRGRKTGSGRHLSAEREREVMLALRDHAPSDFGIAAADWSRTAVQAFIATRFRHAQIGPQPQTMLRTVDRYLARWSMTDGRRADDRGAALVLWELLGWYPGPTGRLNALARALTEYPWIGRALFTHFRQPWTLRQRCTVLQGLELDHRSSDVRPDDEAELRFDGATFTHRARATMVRNLWRSADRAVLMGSTLASGDGHASRHWSLRMFSVDVRDVHPVWTPTRRLGRIASDSAPWHALFVGLLDLREGDFVVALLRDDAAAEHVDVEDHLGAAVLRQLRPIQVNPMGGPPAVLHLPIGYLQHFRYHQVAQWASDHGVRLVEDMLPASRLPATPEVVHHRLAVRAGGRAPPLRSSGRGRAW